MSRPLFLRVVLLVPFALSACKEKPAADQGRGASPRVLNVSAAASLTESFGEIGRQFEARQPRTRVVFNFSGSQQLRAQLAQGAPADVFASADQKQMEAAAADSLIERDTMQNFARNRLVVIYPRSNPARIASLADLARSGLKIDVADPAVPVGRYTQRMLNQMADDPSYGPTFKAKFLANIVSREENVKAVVIKVRLGEADAGVAYATDLTPDAAKEIGSLPIPDAFNPSADYPLAMVTRAQQPDLARQFIAFILSPDGQTVLRQYGFFPAPRP